MSTLISGIVATVWSLGFAAVSAWQLASGPGESTRYAEYATGLAVMIGLVLVLKLVGAVLALAAITPRGLGLPAPVTATGLWGAFGLLALYCAGSVVIAFGTESGVLEPSAAWTAAGGVTGRSVLYVLFNLIGATAFGVLAFTFHRRHRLRWTVAVIGLVGAPLLLALVLGGGPAILSVLGLLPT